MDCRIILSPSARRDLAGIVRYISFDNPERALSFGRELIAKTKLLRNFPELGRMVPEFGEPSLREIVFRSYRIIYRYKGEQPLVEVVRFWHGARGTPEM